MAWLEPLFGEHLVWRSCEPADWKRPQPDGHACEPHVAGRTSEVDAPQRMRQRPVVPGSLIHDEHEDRIATRTLRKIDQAKEIDR